MNRLALITLLSGAALAAQAQTVWRCGADGRSYADAPCAGGQVVAVADPRSAADVAQARAVLARDMQRAQQMTAERQAREREARALGNGMAGIKPMQAVKQRASTRAERPRSAPKQRAAASARTSIATARGSLQKLD
jgi:hypothetical protein